MTKSKKPILVVEDPAGDTAAAHGALTHLTQSDRVLSATTPETLTYLKSQREQRPCVVLLTVDEASDDGLATLRTIKQDEQLRSVPVVVLGPSGDSQIVDESFELGAAGYMVKSADASELSATMRTLYEYWSLSELPK